MMGRRRERASGFGLLPRMEARPRKDGKITYRYHPVGGKQLCFHAATFASQLANANCSLHVIAQALGHRTVSQSARYAHIRNDVLREASGAAAAAFRKARLAAAANSEEATAA